MSDTGAEDVGTVSAGGYPVREIHSKCTIGTKPVPPKTERADIPVGSLVWIGPLTVTYSDFWDRHYVHMKGHFGTLEDVQDSLVLFRPDILNMAPPNHAIVPENRVPSPEVVAAIDRHLCRALRNPTRESERDYDTIRAWLAAQEGA